MAFLIAWLGLYLASRFLPLERYNVEVRPLYLVYRTKRFNDLLSEIADRHPRLWRVVFNISVVVAVGLVAFSGYFLTTNLLRFIYAPQEAERVFLLIPGVTLRPRWFPYILITAGFAVTVHEMAHGVAACLEGIPIKSSGIILAVITFGGFVEPEEEPFKEAKIASRLRVVASGSLTNLVVGLLALLLTIGLYLPPAGVLVEGVREGGPSQLGGLQTWDVIYGVNGTGVRDIGELSDLVAGVRIGDILLFETSDGVKRVVVGANPQNESRASLGLTELADYNPMRLGGLGLPYSYYLFLTLSWLNLICLSLAIFNMMPLYPFDGDAFVTAILEAWMRKGVKGVRMALNGFFLTLMVANLGMSLITFGLIPI